MWAAITGPRPACPAHTLPLLCIRTRPASPRSPDPLTHSLARSLTPTLTAPAPAQARARRGRGTAWSGRRHPLIKIASNPLIKIASNPLIIIASNSLIKIASNSLIKIASDSLIKVASAH